VPLSNIQKSDLAAVSRAPRPRELRGRKLALDRALDSHAGALQEASKALAMMPGNPAAGAGYASRRFAPEKAPGSRKGALTTISYADPGRLVVCGAIVTMLDPRSPYGPPASHSYVRSAFYSPAQIASNSSTNPATGPSPVKSPGSISISGSRSGR
jgi:hypothetical protein